MYNYKAKVVNVVDGDTVDMEVDLGFNLKFTQRFRIMLFDAPESWRPRNEAERIHGLAAKNRAIELLLNNEVTIDTLKDPGIYGRFSAKIYLPDGRNFADIMISEGFQKLDEY